MSAKKKKKDMEDNRYTNYDRNSTNNGKNNDTNNNEDRSPQKFYNNQKDSAG